MTDVRVASRRVHSQWLSYTKPDTADGVQFRALCEACDELCHVRSIAPGKLFLWIECAPIRSSNTVHASDPKPP